MPTPPTDPLVTALLAAYSGTRLVGSGMGQCARLSSVIAAARKLTVAVRADNCEPSSAVDYATERLEKALAAADGAR
jgi:hypothetical protein